MDKSILSNRYILGISSIVVVTILILSFVYLPSYFEEEEKQVDETDWHNYPYVIPGTDMRFPDEEGLYPEGKTWISFGFKIDFVDSDLDRMYMILLYHENYKDVGLFPAGDSQKNRIPGNQTLPEGKMDMKFDNPGSTEDIFKAKEGEAFHYYLHSFLNLGDGREYELEFDLESQKPPATMFDGEVEVDNYYYRYHALTRCSIDGSISIDGESHEVGGLAYVENLRGSFTGARWDWFAFWTGHGAELKLVDLYGNWENKQYAMYVDPDGNILSIKNLTVEVTSINNGLGYSWEVSSDRYDIDLNFTCIEERTEYNGYAVGFGRVRGSLMGSNIDTFTYIEVTKPRR